MTDATTLWIIVIIMILWNVFTEMRLYHVHKALDKFTELTGSIVNCIVMLSSDTTKGSKDEESGKSETLQSQRD